ncbi:MAG: RNA-guided endonuclease InsQ/TnpB family protein [Mycobacterium sp.]
MIAVDAGGHAGTDSNRLSEVTVGLSVPADTVLLVKQVVKVRVLPTGLEAAALEATLCACNSAASWLSARMHADGVHRKYDAQKHFYTELRRRFGLSAQPTIRVIGKVADAYTTLRANAAAGNYGPPGSRRRTKVLATPIVFRDDAAQPFDARCLSWQIPEMVRDRKTTVSIWTMRGRLRKIRILAAPRDLALLRTRTIGECDLVHRDGKWFLYGTVEAPEAPLTDPVNGFVGVDLGIVNIATTSDGDRAAGARLNRYRKRQAQLRKRLQAKKTSSARRLLRKRRRKERRFATDVNHYISKRIVAVAERTGRGIAVEQLGGIRDRVRLRKPQRATLHSWAFAQIGGFLAYKAQAAGVAFVQVDPAHTSQTCNRCGRVDKRNRRSQSVFECVRCGFVGHADHNAANNIAQRGVVRWGEVMRPNAAPTLTAS